MSSLPKPTTASRGDVPLVRPSVEALVPAEEPSATDFKTAWQFAVHACVGTAVFAAVAIPAIGLNWFVEFLEVTRPIDPVIVLGLRVAEYAVFGVDVLLFLIFLIKNFFRTIKEL